MQICRNKTIAIFITTILVLSLAISIGALSTANAYGTATQNAINAGMYWTGMSSDASSTRLLLFNRFNDNVPTHVFIVTAPTPIGIGQQCNVVFFNPQVPPTSATTPGSPRYWYTFKVTTPSGAVENFPTATPPGYSSWSQNSIITLNGQLVFQSDSTGSSYMTYTPDETGNYTFTVTFVEFRYLWNGTSYTDSSGIFRTGGEANYYGVVFKASTYTTTLVVQQEPVSLTGLTTPAYYPVPTQYWTRPIQQENSLWWTIASNWLANSHDYNNGGSQNAFQADGTAPNTGHILWTVPEEDSGILGGSNTGRPANTFNTGSQYQPRLTPPIYGGEGPIIMYGRIYYSPSIYYQGYSEYFNCIDLKTGRFLYQVNTTEATGAVNRPAFGYYYDQDDVNEHGIQNPGWLFTSSYTVGYQPEYGYPQMHLSNVPGGTEAMGPNGENLRYAVVSNSTNSYLTQWNSSKVLPMLSSGATPSPLKYIGNVPITPARTGSNVWNGTAWGPTTATNFTALGANQGTSVSYDWNVTLTYQGNPFYVSSATIAAAKVGDIVWGYNSSWQTGTSSPSYAYAQNVTVWAINIDPTSTAFGTVLYVKNIDTEINPTSADPLTGNQNLIYEHSDANLGVFIAILIPAQQYYVWNMRTGDLLFTTDAQSQTISPYGYYTWPSLISGTQVKTAYGMLYTGGYSGTICAYPLNSTGSSVSPAWKYEVIPPGTAGVIKSSPGMMAGIADGKIYAGCHEHSAETPLEAGNQMKCINATDGTLLWAMSGWVYPSTFAVADGVLVYLNNYDEQIYGVGQGPTKLTVTAPDVAAPIGTAVTIRGTITDVSPGASQTPVKQNFPNGLPAISDASMSGWMEYVYMQKALPSTTTGVPISIDVVDSNGNYRHIGDVTSDASGMFTLSYKPDIEGSYTVIATFHGSNSYYGTYSETSFAASAAPATAPPTAAPVDLATTQNYVLGIGIAIIIVVAIVGALIMVSLRKRP